LEGMTSLFGSPASREIEGKANEVIREICYTHPGLNCLHVLLQFFYLAEKIQ
jgi:hypothetical protein